MKWPLPNKSKHPRLLKNYKAYAEKLQSLCRKTTKPMQKNYKAYAEKLQAHADLDSTAWKNSSKKQATERMGLIKAF